MSKMSENVKKYPTSRANTTFGLGNFRTFLACLVPPFVWKPCPMHAHYHPRTPSPGKRTFMGMGEASFMQMGCAEQLPKGKFTLALRSMPCNLSGPLRLRVQSRSRTRLRIAVAIAFLFCTCFKEGLGTIAPLSRC